MCVLNGKTLVCILLDNFIHMYVTSYLDTLIIFIHMHANVVKLSRCKMKSSNYLLFYLHSQLFTYNPNIFI